VRALVCEQFGRPAEVAHVKQWPEPASPADNEVTIDVAYASVSHSSGLLIEGKYQTTPPLPFIPGTEAVGTVVACGPQVKHVQPGDRVMGLSRWGCFAERINVSAHTVYPILNGMGWLQALPLPNSYGTAYTALLWRAKIEPGESLLVLGAGSGTGLACVEIAAALGVKVIACASTPAKRALALARGADHAVEPGDALASQVKALTEGRGVDVIFDPIGGAVMERAVRATAQGARILTIGFASGQVPVIPMNIALVKNLSVLGFFFGLYTGWTHEDETQMHLTAMRKMMSTLQRWALAGKIQPGVTKTYPLTGLTDALTDLHLRQVTGKLALEILGDINK
jgi:NADPH:quinone reductase